MMNEQMKQLMGQTLDEKFSGTWSTMDMQDLQKFAERFAEKIVQECVDVIQKEVSMKYKDGGETEEFMGGHYAGSLLARVKIKRHFGVEE
jgi:hypothetical protein